MLYGPNQGLICRPINERENETKISSAVNILTRKQKSRQTLATLPSFFFIIQLRFLIPPRSYSPLTIHLLKNLSLGSFLSETKDMDISDIARKLDLSNNKLVVRKAAEIRRLCDAQFDSSVIGVVRHFDPESKTQSPFDV